MSEPQESFLGFLWQDLICNRVTQRSGGDNPGRSEEILIKSYFCDLQVAVPFDTSVLHKVAAMLIHSSVDARKNLRVQSVFSPQT